MADSTATKNWRDLIKPRRLQVDAESLTPTYGKFIAEPLERGFGTTIGNSLRRVLLSSLQGAAITTIRTEPIVASAGRPARNGASLVRSQASR